MSFSGSCDEYRHPVTAAAALRQGAISASEWILMLVLISKLNSQHQGHGPVNYSTVNTCHLWERQHQVENPGFAAGGPDTPEPVIPSP